MLESLRRKLFDFQGYRGGLFDCDCACAAAPNYQPVADASKESAEVMARLGREQLAESRRQYDLNKGVIDPIIALQKQQMEETNWQGRDYYDYNVNTFRPVEQGLVRDADEFSTRDAQERYARLALADMERAQAMERAQSERAMASMGINPNSGRFAGLNRAQEISNAAMRAGTMANARERADQLGWAKRMDVTGMARGLPGASQGAYSLALNSGNAAAGNQMGLGNQLLTGMNQGAGTIGSGQQMQLQGLGSILNAQTSFANSQNQMYANMGDGGLGGLLGAASNLGAAWIMKSDRRLKENIVPIDKDDATGLTLYEFTYKDDPEQRRYRGVMADEVEQVMPAAVVYDDLGFASVNYTMLGIEMVEV